MSYLNLNIPTSSKGDLMVEDGSGVTKLSVGSNDQFLIADSTASVGMKWETINVGEDNTASNIGTAGVGLFKQKNGLDLEFKKINAGSNKVTITDDTANNEVDIDVDQANINYWTETGSELYYNGGNVGIGTATPGSSSVHIYGKDFKLESSGANAPFIQTYCAQTGTGDVSKFNVYNTDGSQTQVGEISWNKINSGDQATDMYMKVHNGTSLKGAIKIHRNGKPRFMFDDHMCLHHTNTSSTNLVLLRFRRSATDFDGVYEGEIRLNGSGNLAFTDPSDIRLKENVKEFLDGYKIVKNLRSVCFDWKDSDKPKECKGFIAQEVQKYLPKSVASFKDEKDDEYLNVSTNEMIPVMWSAIRTLIKKVEELEAKQ